MRSRRYHLIAGSSLLLLASASGAQTPAPEASLEEIIVTARRKDESIQDVPQVVDAVTPETLAKYNIQSFQDVAILVPGLTLSNDGSGFAAKAAIRGANFEINSATSPTVAFYLNEAVLDANFLLQSMFDVGQIEVLRGPQGTLRGRSAPSGAITVTTHKADLSGFGGYTAVTGTNQDQIKAEGALNLPLIEDVLAVRVAGVVDDNQFDHVRSVNASAEPHQHTSAERISVTFEPSDAFSLTSTYQHLERNLRSYVQLAGSGALGAATPGGCAIQGGTGNIAIPCPAAGYNGPVLTSEDRVGVQNQALPVTTEYDVVTAQADYVRGLYTHYPSNNRASGEGTGFTADSYGMLNLYAGVRSSGGAWDIQLFARNLANTKTALTYEANSEKDPVSPVNLNFGDSGYHRTSVTALREFGITARYSFGTR